MTAPDLTSVVEYLEDRADVRDGPEGAQLPNAAMQALTTTEDAITAWDRVGDEIEKNAAELLVLRAENAALRQVASNWKAAFNNLALVFKDVATEPPYTNAVERIKASHNLK